MRPETRRAAIDSDVSRARKQADDDTSSRLESGADWGAHVNRLVAMTELEITPRFGSADVEATPLLEASSDPYSPVGRRRLYWPALLAAVMATAALVHSVDVWRPHHGGTSEATTVDADAVALEDTGPRGDYAVTTAKQFFFDVWHHLVLTRLSGSSDERIAGLAAKGLKEARYHRRRSTEWMLRLGQGTEESHRRLETQKYDEHEVRGDLKRVGNRGAERERARND